MRRPLLALPVALLLSLLVAGTAFATHCGNASKPDGAGQHALIVVDLGTGGIVYAEGLNKNGKLRGGFIDVYLDFDGDSMPSAGDCVINDTYILSEHSGRAAPGQNDGGLAVIPSVIRFADPGGSGNGVGFAELVGFCPFE
jgi:hypothetical protein